MATALEGPYVVLLHLSNFSDMRYIRDPGLAVRSARERRTRHIGHRVCCEARGPTHVPQERLRTKASMWRSPAHACSLVRPGKISTPFAQISSRWPGAARRATASQGSPSSVTVAAGLALRL